VRRFAVAVLVLSAARAGAVDIQTPGDPVHVDGTSTSIGAWHAPNGNGTSCDDRYGELLERLNVSASYGPWVAGIRLDGSLYLNRPQATDFSALIPCSPNELIDRYFNSVIPEKIWAGYNGRNLEVTLGDSYVTFGRGLSLSLRKTDQLGLDTSSRGARVKLDVERVSAIIVAGFTNINNIDEATGRFAYDPNDLVTGGQVMTQLADGIKLGADAVVFSFHNPPPGSVGTPGMSPYGARWLNAGPIFDAPRLTPWLGVYAEGIMQRRTDINGQSQTGFGAYGTATVRMGAVTALLEGKAYGDLAIVQPQFPAASAVEFAPVQYAVAPTAERVLQPLEHPQRNIYGGRLRIDWAIRQGITVYVNDGLFRDAEGYQMPGTGDLAAGTVHDPYGGVDLLFGPLHIQAEGGWRGVFLPDYGPPVRGDGHLDFLAVADLGSGSSVEFHATELARSEVLTFGPDNWHEGTLVVGYRKRPWFAVNGILDYSTQTGQAQNWYPGGQAEFDFNDSSNIRVFGGASRGGLKCVNGICRIFPPFQGVKATLTLRF
jgi:hypothetical protein